MKLEIRILMFYMGWVLMAACSRKISETEPSIGRKQQGQLAEYNFSEGMKEYVLGNYAQAQPWFEKSLSLNPGLGAANYMLSRIYFLAGKIPEALASAQLALKTDPQNKYYYLLTAQVYERQQNFTESAKIYRKMIEEVKGTEEHYYDLAASYIFSQNYDEALKTYTNIESLYGRSADLTRQKQQLFLKINKLDQALNEGTLYMTEFPDDEEFKITQAEILYSNNKTEEALKFLEGIIKSYPQNGQARLLLMEIYKSQGNTVKVKEQMESIFSNPDIDFNIKLKVLEDFKATPDATAMKDASKYAELTLINHPSEGKAYIEAGDIYLMLDKKEDAWQKYIKAKSYEQNDFNLWNKLIILDSELNKPDSMILHSEEALELFPNQAVLWLYEGTGYLIKKDGPKAIDALEQGLHLASNNPEMKNEFNMRLADCYNEVKDYKKSDNAFEEVLRFNSTNEHALNNYSYYLSLRKERLEIAKEMSEKLVKKFPANSTYLDTYAWVLYMMKDYENAKKYLEIAIINSNNGTILEHYGDVLFQLGKVEDAVNQWKKARQSGEVSDVLDKKIRDRNLYEQ